MVHKWYQNVDGVEGAVFKDPRRKESKFWNEGKWNNFIEPLLPKERRTFIELGCNAGLFLKMAMDAGFTDVIGVDSNPQRMKQAIRFRESNKYPYRLIQQTIGKDFELDQLPLADIVLIANMHYHLPLEVFANLVDRLKNRTAHCIVVSAKANRRPGNALHYLESPGVRGYFRDWQEVMVVGNWRGIEGLDEGDPAPRKQMYGALFKGSLEVFGLRELYDASYRRMEQIKKHRLNAFFPAMEDFFKRVLAGEKFRFEELDAWRFWTKRFPGVSSEWISRKLSYKKALAEDVQKNGIREPIRLTQTEKVLDGVHRLIIAKELGYEHVLVRRL